MRCEVNCLMRGAVSITHDLWWAAQISRIEFNGLHCLCVISCMYAKHFCLCITHFIILSTWRTNWKSRPLRIFVDIVKMNVCKQNYKSPMPISLVLTGWDVFYQSHTIFSLLIQSVPFAACYSCYQSLGAPGLLSCHIRDITQSSVSTFHRCHSFLHRWHVHNYYCWQRDH